MVYNIYNTDDKPDDAPLDAFAQVEKAKKTKERTSAHEARIAELEEHSANHWADPFRANAHLRSTFREERRAMYEQQKRDVDLRKRIGWDDDRLLLPRSSKEAGYSTPEIRRKWTQAQEERHKAQLFAPSSKRAHSAMTKELNPAARTLAERLLSKSLMPKHKTRK